MLRSRSVRAVLGVSTTWQAGGGMRDRPIERGTATSSRGSRSTRGRLVAPAPPDDSIGRLPSGAKVYNREAYLVSCSVGRRVTHLGFVDVKNMFGKYEEGAWLHAQLAEVALALAGVDNSEAGIAQARELGFDAYIADCQDAAVVAAAGVPPADLVIAGEIIEHIENLGGFLDATRQLLVPGGELIITTPNPYALTNVLLAFLRREVQNDDHVGWQSWRTLDTLLARHGYERGRVVYYRHPRFRAASRASLSERLRCAAFNGYQLASLPLVQLAPAIADGVIVHARLAVTGV